MSWREELFDRAAECERLMRLTPDVEKWSIFRMLRDMWIILAKDSKSMSDQQLRTEIAAIDEIQVRVSKTVH
jgi:hypothetical protein